MAKEWLEIHADLQGQWKPTDPQQVIVTKGVELGDATVCIHETAHSGNVVLAPADKSLSSYGGAALHLRILLVGGHRLSLPAPLTTPIELRHVQRIDLSVAVVVGNAACSGVSYRAIVNAHCVYEKVAADCHVVSGSTGVIDLNQSFNEIRAVDLTVLGAHDCVVEALSVRGLNLLNASSALVGARIYTSATQALLASANTVIRGLSDNVTVSVPIAATLTAGQSYRVGFYVETTAIGLASGDLFVPTAFPYLESGGMFRINSAHALPNDAFPANPNLAAPQMTIRARAA